MAHAERHRAERQPRSAAYVASVPSPPPTIMRDCDGFCTQRSSTIALTPFEHERSEPDSCHRHSCHRTADCPIGLTLLKYRCSCTAMSAVQWSVPHYANRERSTMQNLVLHLEARYVSAPCACVPAIRSNDKPERRSASTVDRTLFASLPSSIRHMACLRYDDTLSRVTYVGSQCEHCRTDVDRLPRCNCVPRVFHRVPLVYNGTRNNTH